MNSSKIRNLPRHALMCGVSFSVVALFAAPALAQGTTSDQELETVVVTGTLLKGIAPIGSHVVTFDTTDIKATGALTTNQILTNIPQITGLFNVAPVTNTGGSGHDTQPKPTIRNLNSAGGAATLVMVDGHNLVGDGVLATTPDPTVLPALVLQRVDVVPDGGSSIYGSNAVAGIINFITRKSFEGLQVQTSIGTTGNYDSFVFGAITGHAWSSGAAYIAYEYRNNSYQFASDRPYGRQNLIPLGGTVDARSTACALANVTAGSTTYALNSSAVANTPGALAASSAPGQNKCDTTLSSTPQPQDTQHAFFGSVTQHIADGVDFSMTANYARHATTSLGAQVSASGLTITNANPFFQSIGGETKQSVSFNLAPAFGPYAVSPDLLESFQVTPELDVRLGGDWDLAIMGNYGRSHVNTWSPLANTVTLQSGLSSSDPNLALDPYNLNLTNQSVLQQNIQFQDNAMSIQQIEQLRGIARGKLFSLPGGDVQLAVGAQYQYESINASNINGPVGQNNGVAVPGGLVITANPHRFVESVFGEVVVPLVGSGNEMPFVHALQVDLQGRFDHYSDVGDTTNPKIGLTYQPIAGLSLNGNLGTSFNAPSMADKTGATDTRLLLQSSSTVRAPLSVSGATPAQDAIDAQRPSFLIAGGSPDLQSQKANTYSFGFDYQPDFVPGLDLSLTKWHVSLYNLISQAPYKNANQLYTIPQYAPYYILHPTQAQLQTATAGIVHAGFGDFAPFYSVSANSLPYALVDARRHNIGNQFDEGLDFHIAYAMETGWGDANFGLDGEDFTKIKTQAYTGGPLNDQLQVNTSPYQLAAYLGGSAGPLSGRITMNYSAGYTVTSIVGQTHVTAFSPVNLYVSYDLSNVWEPLSGATVGLNVNNLFDTNPPFYNTGSGTANGSTLGRFFMVNLQKKF